MNSFSFAMKSGRENTVAFSSWQGGHHVAPQYRNTGLFRARAAANAEATLPYYQAMAGAAVMFALVDAIALVDVGELAAGTAPVSPGGGAVCCPHPVAIKLRIVTRV